MPAFAQEKFSLTGKITEQASGKALPGASLTIDQRSAVSNQNGDYSIANLRAGIYTLKVSYVGFQTIEKTVGIDGSQQLNFELQFSAYLTDEVIVQATRAGANSATTYQNINKKYIEKNNFGQDLPFLLNQTPGVVVTSDAGAGVGYTGIRIRGSDPTRVNVTLNGIPLNDSESQGTYFVDLPDFASSVDNIQVQRGVGTSTNGAGAFGGSLNIQTTTRSDRAYAELNNTIGSFNTWKNTVNFGTGIIDNKFSFDGRLSRIKSDGYIDRASSNLKSYFLSGAYYGKKSLLRANVFSGSEKTYQAWNGVPENLLKADRTYNSFTYDDQTDNYTQNHYQLLYSASLSPKLTLNSALHYTRGKGYYEEFKEDQKLSKYGLPVVTVGSTTISRTDLVRRRWLDNDFYGITYSAIYSPEKNLNFTFGGAYNEYDGDHFGEVIKGKYVPLDQNQQHYYDGNGVKTDFNIFGKAEYQIGKAGLFADLQYRGLDYRITGTDKNRSTLDFKDNLNFFNPKVGVTYFVDGKSSLYASFAVANKEPNRDDYINSTQATLPKPENLKDIEAGYRLQSGVFATQLNGYYMKYKDQLIVTGKVNDVGEYIRQNVGDSYRMGIEWAGQWNISSNLSWASTAALSSNKVKNFIEYADDYDNNGQIETKYDKTDIAFSPSFVGSSELSFKPFSKTEVALLSKYVSSQYLDNTSNNARKLDAFFLNDVRLSYNTSFSGIKNIGLNLLISNVFGELFESNGYTFSYLYNGDFTTENYYFPQAKQNFLLSLNLKF